MLGHGMLLVIEPADAAAIEAKVQNGHQEIFVK
jgi:hypothetical protein